MKRFFWLTLCWGWLLPAVAMAQVPLPTGLPPEEFIVKRKSSYRHLRKDPLERWKARVAALEAQLSTIQELKNWAGTSRKELFKIYSDSLANLMQARAAIFRAKKKQAPPYSVPKAFEVEPIRVGTGYRYPSSGYSVPVVPPDDFRLFFRATFPRAWVKEKKKLRISCQIYNERYLPMASQYQNSAKAAFRASSYRLKADQLVKTVTVSVNGVGLPPGRYFASCVVSTRTYPASFLVSLGMFRVKGELPRTVGPLLPHMPSSYGTYKTVLAVDKLEARVKGRAIRISGAFTRQEYDRKVEPVYVLAHAVKGRKQTIILRQKLSLKRAKTKLRGKDFVIKDHGLSPGTYTLKVQLLTEYKYKSRHRNRMYTRKCRTEKSTSITIP